jgi:FlhB HrpN YscU SpaS Family
MTNPIYTLLSKQVGLRQQVDLIAHNVANLSTAGFKREGLAFATHVERLDLPGGSLAMAEVSGSHTDRRTGALARTGNPFDFAIEGSGFFKIREIAQDLGIALFEDRPLAHSLYDLVEIGEEIRVEHYRAVAAALHYAARQRAKRGGREVHGSGTA